MRELRPSVSKLAVAIVNWRNTTDDFRASDEPPQYAAINLLNNNIIRKIHIYLIGRGDRLVSVAV